MSAANGTDARVQCNGLLACKTANAVIRVNATNRAGIRCIGGGGWSRHYGRVRARERLGVN